MKKCLSLILVLAMVLCMAAYGAAPVQAENANLFTPGTYTGVGAGKNGDITVEVTFSADKIERITVVSHSETPSLSDTAIAKSTIAGNIVGWTMSAILVNADGNRVVNEKASNRTILEEELQQPGGMLYLLLDSETFEVWKTKLAPAGISEGDIEKYLAANGTTTPVFAHGETLEEAAAAAGVNAENLAATVEKYNSFVEKGEDADFGRNASYLTMKIGAGPYYLIEQKPRFATTMGGLVVNTNMQVLNQDGNAISGLYAAGETCGQVMGDDSPSGANNAWAITSGKLAADAIAAK